MIVKAWIEKGIINCMSQKCTSKIIKDNPDSEILMCPNINICKEYEITLHEIDLIRCSE
jgi:hypothetical protein